MKILKKTGDYPKLNLPACRLRVAERGGETYVWDAARGAGGRAGTRTTGKGRWLVLTPEEWVRRHVLAFLCGGTGDAGCGGGAGISAANISQEHPVEVNGAPQRADIVVFGRDGRPLLVVECKAPSVAVTGETLAQAFRYNAVVGARYVMLTNGLDHYIYEVRGGEYIPLKEFPDLAAAERG